ncbi:MAG: PLP-dependent aspartate aminotransferase family protein [Candidatus Caenarcaniphilales bacterium]|nr:PLP-dependent aspartate aminotransferase family protein [Candidatus Caenarcaniphilales bacterium]
MKNDSSDKWGFETKAILKGQSPDPSTGATIPPIYQTSTYTLEGIGETKGYCYSRTGNPTRSAAAECLASLENGKFGFIYPSGIAAIHTVIQQLNPGDHVVTCEDLYGGAHRLFTQIVNKFGIEFDFVDARDPDNFIKAIKPNTKLVWLETPSNPKMYLCDIKAVVDKVKALAKSENREILVGADNTFASPYLQRPLDFGVDMVMHSCTKYLGGHSDLLLGAIVVRDEELAEKFAYHQNATGTIAAPFDCWLLMRGMKTLAVRMKQHHENSLSLAKWLEKHPLVKQVNCPALESSPQNDLYKKQMDLYNGMISFEIDADIEAVKGLVANLKIFQLAESLGGVESLSCHPATMTHAAVPAERRKELGINDNLIRLSVGIESIHDLQADLEQAFAQLPAAAKA